MALTIDLGVAELAATRFAISPLSETVSCLQQLAGIHRHPVNARWLRWAADELAGEPLALSRTWPLVVSERPSWPEFLVPAPSGPGTSIDDDLAALTATPAHRVRTSLRRVFGAELPEAAAALDADPEAGLRAIAGELRAAHDRLVAPHWSRIRAVLEADIVHRAAQLAAGGAERVFCDLHPDLRWESGRLALGGALWSAGRVVNLAPGGLVLMPVALGSPYVLIKGNSSTQTTVRYPARGVGTLWNARQPRGSTVRLLGRVRAELLEGLRSPATTTDLARSLGVTPSAVSQHLRVLRDSGLVTRRRSGRHVLYVISTLGESLT